MAVSLSTMRGAEKDDSPVLSFGLITDVQYADAEPEGERHYRESISKLKTAVAWLAPKKLPFTLHLGDLIDRDFKSFATVLPLLEGLGHPVRHLLGNHDYQIEDGEKARVFPTIGMPREYYQFRDSGVRFVMLDTNDHSTFKSVLHEPEVNAYSAVHMFADRLEIEGNGREQSRMIPLRRI